MELGRRLRAAGSSVFVTSGPGEEPPADAGSGPDFPHLHGLTVRQLAAIYGMAQLVVSNSTGPLHIAVALGTPTVSVYSPEPACHPRRWGPYPASAVGDTSHAVLIALDAHATELSAVSVEEVLSACQRLLSAPASVPDRK